MNQTNGYCQIELPDRIGLDSLNTAGVDLTDAEVKPIIKALNLDQVLVDEVGYPSYINAWLNKPVIVKAHIAEGADQDVKSIFHASIVSAVAISDNLSVQFVYEDGGYTKLIKIGFIINGGETGHPTKWGIDVRAWQITTTTIS